MTAYLAANGLTKVFGARRWRSGTVTALTDVTFELRPGEVLAFLGPNGAGKTTAINLLLGFLRPTHGTAQLFGYSAGDRRARARLGYLPETYAFYGFLTAPQLLHLFGRMHGIEKRERQRRVDELIETVGLAHARHRPIGQFSRGMRQRVGIAQALINQPDLLILDEPTSGFDPVGRRMVRDLLLGLKQRGTAILLCSHILSEVETLCDRVLILNQGRVVRNGTLSDVRSGTRTLEDVFIDDVTGRNESVGGD